MMKHHVVAAVLGIIRGIAIAALVTFNVSLPARAQYVQTQIVTGAGGSANAQTGTVASIGSYADVVNVPLIYVPAVTNTGDATLTLNGFVSSPHFRKSTASGVTALVGNELINGQPYIIEYDGTYFQLIAPVTLPVNAGNLTNSTYSFSSVPNFQVNATVGSNQLTVAVVANSGSNASSINPITVAFRDSTIANGDPVFQQITGALSITVASGNTMGCQNGIMCRLWGLLINNTGTVGVCLWNANSAGTSIVGPNEAVLQSSASGTAAGSSAQTLYCNSSSISSKAIRYAFYIDIQETTAGTWASGPTYVQLFGPGIHRPGEIVQGPITFTTASTTSCNSTSPIPTVLTKAIVPTSAADSIHVRGTFNANSAPTGNDIFQWSRGSGPTLIGALSYWLLDGYAASPTVEAYDQPNTTSSTTYTLYCSYVTGAFTFNNYGSPLMVLEEIMGSLGQRIPANDDDVSTKAA